MAVTLKDGAEVDYITMDDGTAIVTLTNGQTVFMREPTVKDQKIARKAAGKDDDKLVSILLGNLCEISQEELDAMTIANFNRLAKAFEVFTS